MQRLVMAAVLVRTLVARGCDSFGGEGAHVGEHQDHTEEDHWPGTATAHVRMDDTNERDAVKANRGPRRGAASACTKSRPFHKLTRRSRRALAMTDTELNVIAALAKIGLSRIPTTG